MTGRFIVLEGIDGCGSTTQAKLLQAVLRERGHDVELTSEPSDGPIGKLIRQALLDKLEGSEGQPRRCSWATMALLFAADRLDHVDQVIRPALERGAIVISDRYDLSSLTYQSATATTGSDVVGWVRALNARALRPDLTIVLHVTPEIAGRRRLTRGGPEEIYEKTELQRTLAGLYREAQALVPGDTIAHVDADGGVEQVQAEILRAVLHPDAPH